MPIQNNKRETQLNREIYSIAKKQHALTQLTIINDEKQKMTLSFTLNDSSKTAKPVLMNTIDKKTKKKSNNKESSVLLKASAKLIRNHRHPTENQRLNNKFEQLTNATKHLAEGKAKSEHPELSKYYRVLPEVVVKSKEIGGKVNAERFLTFSKKHMLLKIAKEYKEPKKETQKQSISAKNKGFER